MFPTAQAHQGLLQMNQIFFRQVVFLFGAGITRALHEVLWFHIVFPQTVDYDMYMDVTASVMAVHVRTDQSLMSGEIFAGIFKSQLLRPLSGQSVFFPVLRIKADDIVMGFDLVVTLVF